MGARRCLKKKKFIASFLRQHGCVYVRNGRFLEFRRATRGPDLAQVHTWRRGTPGAEESTGLRSRDLDSGSSPSAHQPLGNSVCPSGKWEARLFTIFPSVFFFCWKTCETQALEGHLIHSWFEAMTKHRFILLSKWAELRPLVKRWLRWQKRDRRRG